MISIFNFIFCRLTEAAIQFGDLLSPTRSKDATSLGNIPTNLTDAGNLRARNGSWVMVLVEVVGMLAVTVMLLGDVPSSIAASSPASVNLGTACSSINNHTGQKEKNSYAKSKN